MIIWDDNITTVIRIPQHIAGFGQLCILHPTSIRISSGAVGEDAKAGVTEKEFGMPFNGDISLNLKVSGCTVMKGIW